MKCRPADLTMLDVNASWCFPLHEALLCELSCFSLHFCETVGNGVVNVWLCLNRLLRSLVIFQKEGNNRLCDTVSHVQDTKAEVYKNEFHCHDSRRQCWYMTDSLTVSLREEKILWTVPKWASILPCVCNEYAAWRLCITHMSFSFIYPHIRPSLNGHWAPANCLPLCQSLSKMVGKTDSVPAAWSWDLMCYANLIGMSWSLIVVGVFISWVTNEIEYLFLWAAIRMPHVWEWNEQICISVRSLCFRTENELERTC